MVLEKIHKENDIKNLSPEELTMLADEIRQFLIEKISVVCDTLIAQAKDGTITNLTPEVTKNIHEGMLTMAKLVESYGLFLHRRTELVASREQLIEKLEKRF